MNTLTDCCNRTIIGELSANSVVASSDDRLKFNEVVISNGLEVIKGLVPKVYDKSTELNVNVNTSREAGLIAQELLNTEIGYCVTGGDETGHQGMVVEKPYKVNYNVILSYLVSAVKEQQVMIEQLQASLNVAS